ncbi:hypothetical protein GGS23DRAFT_396100 [Durotheca rogersii]|uniref:uncharacterized protein n=1 Tax=Durotheca rogersii TaxID=419775 RepID=UPI0022209C44|nr:uncharacterized protein GGS23DRAFT_396100 [Durotheca rogersii]KAI5856711.1 hypothetical protein GGS23DRAFT_396100 [Durotheca rogersii]
MPAKKRKAAEAATPGSVGGSRRRSQRISTGGKKSAYFEGTDDDDDYGINDKRGEGDSERGDQTPPRKRKAGAKTEVKTSSGRRRPKKTESDDEPEQYEDDGYVYKDDDDDHDNDTNDKSEDGEDTEEEEEEEEYETPPVQKRRRGRPAKQQAGTAATPKSKAKSRITTKTKAKNGANAKAKAKVGAKPKPKEPNEAEDNRDDEVEDDEYDEDHRITVTYLPTIELRDTGGVEYEDTRLHQNTLLFLKDLKANNYRKWLKTYDEEYRRSLKDWESFVETLTERIVEVDDTIPELPVKDVIFRIYRDIRFSNDHTPYKPHFSAAWSRTGRKGPYACYYVHVEPGRCMVGGGLWHPAKEALALLRASVDERPHRIRRVLGDPAFRRTFLPEAAADADGDDDDVEAALKAFAQANQEGALKIKPKGFHPEHRDIELLKLRNYTVVRHIDDADLTAADAQDRIIDVITPMVRFVSFLNSVVMPDPNLDEDSDGGEGGGDE